MIFFRKALSPHERHFNSTGLDISEVRRGVAALDLIYRTGSIATLNQELEMLPPRPRISAAGVDMVHADELTAAAMRLLGLDEDLATDAVLEQLTRNYQLERLAAIERAAQKVAQRVTKGRASA